MGGPDIGASIRALLLAGARCPGQVDVGFGDAVTPGPEPVECPTMVSELTAPRLRAYQRETVAAEKLEALDTLGVANSRMQDGLLAPGDLWVLASHADFDGDTLDRAIRATFERRATRLPEGAPFGLTEAVAEDSQEQTQWRVSSLSGTPSILSCLSESWPCLGVF